MSSEPDTSDFHMVQLWLDGRGLTTLGKMLNLPLARTGTPYLTHCALGELFGGEAPQPYCIESNSQNGRHVRLLGYADADEETLHSQAQIGASPTVYNICDWDRLESKPMPTSFREGIRLGFELRTCPVVRKASAGPKWSKGQEIDAFLSEVWEIDDPSVDVDREEVYRDWLRRQLDIRGGAKANTINMQRFSIERMTRRTHGGERNVKTIQRPDVTLSGTLTVTDGPAFAELLKRGIGRHKSFGYGMLKIRRA